MLEQPALQLGPWRRPASGDGESRVRAVITGKGAPIGFVRQAASGEPRWLSWLGRRTLEVCETPDGSLVFALRRGWGWAASWRVADADGRLVGLIRGRALVDGFGNFLAAIEHADQWGWGRFLAAEGRELGEYRHDENAIHIAFAPDMEGNPFAKMMLLAAALIRDV